MIKFYVATNWQEDLIPLIRKEYVDELYGKLSADFIGGGRASSMLPQISKKHASIHIQKAHESGLKFNYLLNATCLDNLEWTITGQRKIRALLDWIVKLKVDSVTVSIPYLLELIKKRYPKLKVYVSTQAGVDGPQRAIYWYNLGADRITLSVLDVNRDFPLLKEIRKSVKCELQLIANLECLYRCPIYKYHSVLNAHSSQSNHITKGFVIDYCHLRCNFIKIANPVEFIRAGWIRPEDIHYYEDIGINHIKLVNRGMSTQEILLIVNAYSDRYYNGNLLDLFSAPTKNIVYQNPNLIHKLRYFFRPFSVNIFKLLKYRRFFTGYGIYIDNQKLEGFLEYFLKESCSLKSCKDCGYCDKVAKKVIKIDEDYRNKNLTKYQEFLDNIISGEIFKYI